MIEVERKFRLSAQEKQHIYNILQQKDKKAKDVEQNDQVLLQGINSFAEFRQGMPIVRLRSEDGNTILTYKRSINDSGDSIEHELEINNPNSMLAILQEMDYRIVTTVKKRRFEVQEGYATFALDTVDMLGDFLEIEILVDSEDKIPDAIQNIMKIARDLGLSESQLESKKYDQLIAALSSGDTQ